MVEDVSVWTMLCPQVDCAAGTLIFKAVYGYVEILLPLESAAAVLCVIKLPIPCRQILTGGLQRVNAG